MSNSVDCPICSAPSVLYVIGNTTGEQYFTSDKKYKIAAGNKHRLGIYQCSKCGHGFSPININQDHVNRWYAQASTDHTFLGESSGRRRTARRVLRFLNRLISSQGSLLDIGSGPGIFISEAKKTGWRVSGLEIANWSIRHANKSLGENSVRYGSATDLAGFSINSIDVITAFDVIEHVINPQDFIKQVLRVIKPGGLLVITTPRFDSLAARVMKKKWFFIFPEHLHYFSFDSLSKLLSSHGFTIVATRHHVRFFSVAYLMQRLFNYLHFPFSKMDKKRKMTMPFSLGDEFELYAQKKQIT